MAAVLLSLFLVTALSVREVSPAWRPVGKTRPIRLKQGGVVGMLYESDLDGLGPVEVFRGLPYAQATRFMPPASPARFEWMEALKNGPVCPQSLLELEAGMKSSGFGHSSGSQGGGRLAYLRRLRPFLQEQNEDCLNLNIYVPSRERNAERDEPRDATVPTPPIPTDGLTQGRRRVHSPLRPSKPSKARRKLPNPRAEPSSGGDATHRRCRRAAYLEGLGGNLNVIVFIHGESFSWNSGNPYDGSTIASYGNVIFVTINYRLGVLGFLNTRNNRTTSNFGLLDQIAALRWLKDNIAAFGGDPAAITLMGHHTGAIAVNYLMLSPIADSGLFQRAILMSGTALSGWAATKYPEKMARSVAEQTHCPEDNLLDCLRERSLEDILALRDLPEDPAPSVDGVVVKIAPKDLMSHNNDVFTKYDLLCGVTESESYHILDAFALNQGLFSEDIKELLEKFFKGNFEHWEQAMERAMKVYGLDKPPGSPMEGRDNTLTLLSDARVVAPMVQAAVYHSTPGKGDIRTYFYVFSHRSKHGDHPMARMSVQGEDLAYVLGVPLEVGLHHFPEQYSLEEKHLSETIMSLWVNFAKTGNPNRPRRTNYLMKGEADWALEDVDWPPFEPINQHFYQIQIPPRIGTKYRDNLMHFWNYFLPTWKPLQVPNVPPNKYTSTKYDPVLESCLGYDEPPRRPPQHSETDWSVFPPRRPTRRPVYGIVIPPRRVTPFPLIPARPPPPMDDATPTGFGPEDNTQSLTTASSFTLSVVIFVGILFLMINLFSFAYVWYQKKKLREERMITRYRRETTPGMPDEDSSKKDEKCEIKSILKSNERLYDSQKIKGSVIGKWTGLYSHGSASTVTMDPHSKVSQWMTSDKSSHGSKGKSSSKDTVVSAASTSRVLKSNLRKPEVKKVSVAVDATPSARSASVLKQTPIELTKSLDFGKRRLGAAMKPSLQRSSAIESEDESPSPKHSHSISDPVDFLYTDDLRRDEKSLKTFEPLPIDYMARGGDEASHSADETIGTFKRRNYPKVLPDLPMSFGESNQNKRKSLPIPTPNIDSKRFPPPPPPRSTTATVSRSPKAILPGFLAHEASFQQSATTTKEKDDKPSKSKEEKKKENKIERRQEPRVIIRPTLTDPNQKKIKGNSKIPRVTPKDVPDSPKTPQKELMKELKNNLKAKSEQTRAEGTDTSGTSGSSSVSSIATIKKSTKE